MSRPSKGERGAHTVKLYPDVTDRLVSMASAAGASSLSQYTADVLALHVGLPEHVIELNRATLMSTSSQITKSIRDKIMIRPPRAVSQQLVELATDQGTNVSIYIGCVLAAHVGLPRHARTPEKREALPLAM